MRIDRSTIRKMLDFSEHARLSQKELKKKLPDAQFIEDKKTDTQCFCLMMETSAVIAFRGTQQTRDWLTDFNAWQVEYPYDNIDSDIMVHRGFNKAYRSVRSRIHNFIKTNNVGRIFVCGHSLGGALATLCAVDMQFNFTNEVYCYPSGNPMVGNKAFVESYNKRVPNTIRTYMRTDLVPELPPKWFMQKTTGGYPKHTKHANPIGPRNIFIGIKNWIRRKFKTDRFAADITNHSMKLYKKYA